MSSLRTVLTAAAVAALTLAAGPSLAQATASATASVVAPRVDRSVKVEPGGLYEIAFNPADNTLLIAAVGPRGETVGRVARLDATTLEPGAAIDVSAAPVYGLGLNRRTQVLYGTSTRGGTVTAIDVRTGTVLGEIKDGDEDAAHLREAIVDEQRDKVYVTIVGGEAGDTSRPNLVWVIDGATRTLERKIPVAVGGLTGAALDAAANRLYVTGMTSNSVEAIDLTTGQSVGVWPTGSERPTNVAVDAAGSRLFVASQGSGDLTVMNAADGAVIQKVATGEGALSVLYSAADDRIYVSNRVAGTVTVVSGADYSVIANLPTGTLPQSLALNPATNAVYVTNKARGLPRGAPAGTPVPVDANGDTVSLVLP